MTAKDEDWVAGACTLPTEERPLRRTEFDALFGTALRDQRRLSPTLLRWELDPATETEVRDLTRRETECCSFFTFTVRTDGRRVRVDVEVPQPYVPVLDALAARAAAGMTR
jgi:hypothetical protein